MKKTDPSEGHKQPHPHLGGDQGELSASSSQNQQGSEEGAESRIGESPSPTLPSPTSSAGEQEKPWDLRAWELYQQPISVERKPDLLGEIFEEEFNRGHLSVMEMAQIISARNAALIEMFDYWLLKKLWSQEKYDEASRFAASLLESTNPTIRKTAQFLHEQYYLVREASRQKIGVLLRTKEKADGQILESLKTAFGVGSNTQSPFELIVEEEPDQFEDLRKAFERLVRRHHVIVIFGGTRNKTRPYLAQLSHYFKTPFIYLGQKSQVTAESPYFYHYSLTLESQIRTLAAHAYKRGLRRLAIIFPNDGYGVDAANLMWDEWLALGGKVVAAQTYHPEENDFQELAAILSNKHDLAPRMAEFRKRQREKLQQFPHLRRRILSQTPVELLPAQYDFDFIFIPDLSRTSIKVLSSLAYYGIRHIPVYGTRLWMASDTFKLAGSLWAPHLIFSDSAYVLLPVLPSPHPFVQDFRHRTGRYPDVLEVNAFEVGLLIKEILVQKAPANRGELKQILEDQFAIQGVLGQKLYFDEYREMENPIVLFQFNSKGALHIVP
ncbi:MAG: penicillin-binding protein activator [Pseudobdellovibrionaceae bacterium]|nr:penicillin-binding protein activator [Pseudobdellovibrionaceae bacterium]